MKGCRTFKNEGLILDRCFRVKGKRIFTGSNTVPVWQQRDPNMTTVYMTQIRLPLESGKEVHFPNSIQDGRRPNRRCDSFVAFS